MKEIGEVMDRRIKEHGAELRKHFTDNGFPDDDDLTILINDMISDELNSMGRKLFYGPTLGHGR
jgi:hypothetical protein